MVAPTRRKAEPHATEGPAIRVLVVDDSITTRTCLSRIVESNPRFEVAAAVNSAEQALDLLRSVRVDVIMLDLEMPGMGGLSAIPRIIALAPQSRILVVSSTTVDGAEQSLAALALGATDTFPKPRAGGFDAHYRAALAEKLRLLGSTGAGSCDMPLRSGATVAAARCSPWPQRLEAVGIGASTGGIHALCTLFAALPARIGAPIFVTQHLPANFMPIFARQLADASGRRVHVACEGMVASPDEIVIAPGDAHLVPVSAGKAIGIRLDRTPVANCCMPSVDPMFEALAQAVGSGVLGIVLSGMGRDGAEGAASIVSAGGAVLAQSRQTSAVWGMPRAVSEAGLGTAALSPTEIAMRITMMASA